MNPRKDWALRHALLLAGSALLLLVVFESTALDLQIEQAFFDPTSRIFPLRDQWLLEKVLHHGLKNAAYLAGFISLALCYLGHRGKLAWLPPPHARLAALGTIFIPLGVVILKHLTNRHCPWDLVDFGGFEPYHHLLEASPAGLPRGQCFPAGHASGGYVWIVWAVALGAAGRRYMNLALYGALLLGSAMGLGRMLQGAHFLSHTLWSLWFAWALTVLLAWWLRVPMPDDQPDNTVDAALRPLAGRSAPP